MLFKEEGAQILSRATKYFHCLVTTAIFLCMTAQIARSQSEVVEELEIRGNRTVSRDAILKHIKTKAGEPFSRKQADEDLESVLKIGVFDKEASRLQIETA